MLLFSFFFAYFFSIIKNQPCRYGPMGVLCTIRRGTLVHMLQATLTGSLPIAAKECVRLTQRENSVIVEFSDGSSVDVRAAQPLDCVVVASSRFFFLSLLPPFKKVPQPHSRDAHPPYASARFSSLRMA